MAYDTQAQEFAYGFYARGYSKERALREIRKCYPGLSGSTWDEWVSKLDWKQRRALADAKLRDFEELARNTASVLLLELDEVRKRLYTQIQGGKELDTQLVYAFNSVSKQINEIARQHLASRDDDRIATQVLNLAFERFLAELTEIPVLGEALRANAARVGQAVEKIAEQLGREG